MKKALLIACISTVVLSCGSSKKITNLEEKNKYIQDLLNTCAVKLNLTLEEYNALSEKFKEVSQNNQPQTTSLDIMNSESAADFEKLLEGIREDRLKSTDPKNYNRNDSIASTLVTDLRKSIGESKEIEINVDKDVVFISISDKLLFGSGSYVISDGARDLLGKVASIINGKPDFECMVEGHTDNVPLKSNGIILDNWDLSVKRSTAIVRALIYEFKVSPKQLIASGRGEFMPVVENTTPENRSANRRARIMIMPKISQFYKTIEKK